MIPTQIRGTNAYTFLGFTGYVLATCVGIALCTHWQLSLGDRIAALVIPPAVFVGVVAAIRIATGVERIVFYETALPAVCAALGTSLLLHGNITRVADVTTLGIGSFLVLGRVGCAAVACCHGRPARRGIAYGAEHVELGLAPHFAHRRLWPVQLVESAASLTLVLGALALGGGSPGTPALFYLEGYALVRFPLELVRGDAPRPYFLGASEAQWTAVVSALACAAWRPQVATFCIAGILAIAIAAVIARRGCMLLVAAPHIEELALARERVLADGKVHATRLGISVSVATLPDGEADWMLSSQHPSWTLDTARTLARALWPEHALIPGRLPGVVHVVVADARTR